MNTNYPELHRKLQNAVRKMGRQLPDVMKSVGTMHTSAYRNGAIETRQKELIALGIGISIRCNDCITFHVHGALSHGASREEIIECIGIAIQMGGGPSVMYGAHALEALDQFSEATV